MRRPLLVLGLLSLQGCALLGFGEEPARDPVAEFIHHLDRERAAVGCAEPLIWDTNLAEIAMSHTIEMMVTGSVRHVSASGADVARRLEDGGVYFLRAAENLAAGPVGGKRVFRLWYNSPGHRRNMLNCDYTHHGVAFRRAYWTHVLVRYPPRGLRSVTSNGD